VCMRACVAMQWQECPEKEELEPWIIKDMDRLLGEAWLTGNEDVFQQIFHFILNENVSGNLRLPFSLPVEIEGNNN